MRGNGDYISREEAREAVWQILNRLVEEVDAILDDIPAADVRPVVLAYWKSVPHKRARVCSRCEADEPYKFADDDANVYNYCPNCGADMREKS